MISDKLSVHTTTGSRRYSSLTELGGREYKEASHLTILTAQGSVEGQGIVDMTCKEYGFPINCIM